tara:strand:+ start:1970 stop:2524 length:555 start_codon:yes stop_codon:yes gene_type:complete
MKNILAENMRRFGTKNLTEAHVQQLNENRESSGSKAMLAVVSKIAAAINARLQKAEKPKGKVAVSTGKDSRGYPAYGLTFTDTKGGSVALKPVDPITGKGMDAEWVLPSSFYAVNAPWNGEGEFRTHMNMISNFKQSASNLMKQLPRELASPISSELTRVLSAERKGLEDIFRADYGLSSQTQQ